MGPNGSGKSTLSKILAGHPSYVIEKGIIEFSKQNLLEMSPEVRSHEGLFLAFQYPIEIAGVTNYDFLRIAYNEKQKYLKKEELDPLQFMEVIQVLKKANLKYSFQVMWCIRLALSSSMPTMALILTQAFTLTCTVE